MVRNIGFKLWNKRKCLFTTENITPIVMDLEVDPHAWNSLRNGIVYVTNIAEVLKKKCLRMQKQSQQTLHHTLKN